MLAALFYTSLLYFTQFYRTNGQCEPGFANDCFEDIEKSLREKLDVDKNTVIELSPDSLDELCWTLDDALNCTSDIIDTDCSSQEGKDRFDSWLAALRSAYFYVCGESLVELYDILNGISCWNVDMFLNCTLLTVQIGHIEDLLHTDLDMAECGKLRESFATCNKNARVSSCREQTNVEDRVHDLITAFFDGSKCSSGERNTATIFVLLLINILTLLTGKLLS